MEYNDDLRDQDMNCIKQVKKTEGKVSRSIQLLKQELLGNIPDPNILQNQLVPGSSAYLSQDTLTAPAATSFNEPII